MPFSPKPKFRKTTWVPPSAAVTGTATASITEQDIKDGSKTIIITLTGATWKPSS